MPSVVQHTTDEPGSGPTSPQTLTINGTTAGNLIAIILFGSTGTTFSTPTDGSNTYHLCANTTFDDGSSTAGTMYYAPNIAGGNVTISVAYSGNTGFMAYYAFELNGVNTYDNGSFGAATNTGTATTSAFNTSFANEIIVAATINGSSATGAGTGYTLIELTTNYFDVLEYKLVGAGSQTATATMDGTTQAWDIVAGAFYNNTGPTPMSSQADYGGRVVAHGRRIIQK